jgi:tetratricopeptide (TPR) repeat protein
MDKVLILGNDSAEREALAIALEFAGNRCFSTGSLQEAVTLLKKESCELVLGNPPVSDGSWDQIVGTIKAISPKTTVLLLVEDADSSSGADEVITLPYSPVANLSPQFSQLGKSQALLILLPQEGHLKRWSGLPETPGMLNKLAVLYHFQEKYATAERLYKRALKISERECGPQDPKVATILNNLARLYHDQDRYSDAGTLYRRSLASLAGNAVPHRFNGKVTRLEGRFR